MNGVMRCLILLDGSWIYRNALILSWSEGKKKSSKKLEEIYQDAIINNGCGLTLYVGEGSIDTIY